jgi:hypothetical protein
MLIVEDLALLLLDDETGTPAGAGTLHYTLGGAVLVELALLGAVETDGSKVHAVRGDDLADPLLDAAYAKVAEKPRAVQSVLLAVGGDLWNPVVDRLIDRGLIRREKKRVLGLFKMNTLPADDTKRETEIREQIRAVLVDGASPDTRTAALTALLSASGALPSLRPALAWSGEVHRRAKELERGNWGAEAVSTAVATTAAAIATSTTMTVITAVT